ncbi:DUF1620-domain-containing protein [Tilletiaria anomala UBC 951]|uniref:ER membrane protein complex subunit 1 n=1 Tax=Tilletiaria anomala (strain ATCC 24038 / CBS 436.72 / UBC 951) TaxID=1037660 RepID=A0A066VAP8_TILAU|nr:DUF1620-domain-containing protein [Tilletiaria anomala UBC 951]KDN35819.1 DUF1620-domain-containing protein [Tilletiaria anomala UBC 951]
MGVRSPSPLQALLGFLAAVLLVLSATPSALAISSKEADVIDYFIENIGVPRVNSLPHFAPFAHSSSFSAFAEPLAGEENTVGKDKLKRLSSSTSAAQYITPRFHRILNPKTHRPGDKTQTAVYTATESNVIAALNPRQGAIVWRQVFEEDDEIQAFYTAADAVLVISGPGGCNYRLFHALTGWLIWEHHTHVPTARLLPEPGFPGVDASFITAGDAGGDVAVLANAEVVKRLDGQTGRAVWVWSLPEQAGDNAASRVIIRVLATSERIHAVSLAKSSGLISDSSYSISVHTLAHNGTLISTRDIPGSSVPNGAKEVALVSPGGVPHVVWKGRDGGIKSSPLYASGESKLPASQSIYPANADTRYARLQELGVAGFERGLIAAQREDGKGEVLRVSPTGQLQMAIESEEVAHDAVYSGCFDKQGNAYVNRVFFGRSQHLLNFHTFWADANDGKGQITGYSFQYDHDLNGAVLAAPFEVSPVNQYQLVTRSVFVTSSGSMRMIQEDKYMWIREEGLTETTHSVIVELPEKKIGNAEVLAALQGEGFVKRIARHAASLQSLPAYLINFGKRFTALDGEQGSAFKGPAGAPATLRAPESTTSSLPKRKTAEAAIPANAKRIPSKSGASDAKHAEEYAPSLAPRFADANTTASLHRDLFGFRKVIVHVTKRGKVYAMDAGRKGQFIWEKSLVGYGSGEGEAEPKIKILSVFQSRGFLGAEFGPLVTIVADIQSEDDAPVLTRVFEFDPISGKFENNVQEGYPIALGPAKDAFALPDAGVGAAAGRRLVGVFNSHDTLLVHPLAHAAAVTSALNGKFYLGIATAGATALQGYAIGAEGASVPTWRISFAPGESIAEIISASTDAISSQGKVLGNRDTLYKYLNPHAHLIITTNALTAAASAYLVDYVTGAVVFETELVNIDLAHGVQVAFTENWIVLAYTTVEAEEGQITRLVSVELYDGGVGDQTWNWTGNFTSFWSSNQEKREGVQVFQQTYNFPRVIQALSTTATKFGISIKTLIVATEDGHVFSIPRRLLDPRRPVGRKVTQQEAEEWLIMYDPAVPDQPKWTISHVHTVKKARRIITSPALLESTSLVLVTGLDTFFTRVAPSSTFDILSSSFNKPQLLLTIAGLSLGIILTKGPVRSRALKMRW